MTLGPLRFTNAAGGTADWIYPGPAIDLQSPTSAQAVDATQYLIYAESFDRSQWEIATGNFTLSSGTFARTTILFNSLGTTAKISFLNPPAVSIYEIGATDVGDLLASNNLSDVANAATAVTNLGLGALLSAWTSYTPTVTAQTGTITSASATGRYKQIGKTVFVQVDVTVTTAGTGALGLVATLPVMAAAHVYIGTAYEHALTGKSGAAAIGNISATQISALVADATTFIANGNVVAMTAVYEAA